MLNSEKIVVHSFSEIDDHVTQHMKIISLVSRNAEQDGMMETLDRRITTLKTDTAHVYLTDRLSAVESRDTPITIREAMRKLERFLCLEAAGSKNRFRMFYNINKINTSTEIQIQSDWNGVLQRRNLRAEHIVALEFLKDCGDEMTHDQRPALSKSLWSTLLQTALSEGEDEDESNLQLSQGLLSALEHYIPCPSSDEPWVINGR